MSDDTCKPVSYADIPFKKYVNDKGQVGIDYFVKPRFKLSMKNISLDRINLLIRSVEMNYENVSYRVTRTSKCYDCKISGDCLV